MRIFTARTSRTRRLIAILAIALTLPFFGIASYASVNPCTAGESSGVAPMQAKDCCGERHAPCGTPEQNCPTSSCSCAHGCGQPQALDQAPAALPTTVTVSTHVPAPVATLLTATSPDGQWRPPRSR